MERQKDFISVERASFEYEIPIGGLRGLLFRREANGLTSAVIKINRRILLHRPSFEEWLMSHQEQKTPAEKQEQ